MSQHPRVRNREWVDQFFKRLGFLIPARRGGFRLHVYALLLTLFALAMRLAIAPIDGGVQYVTFFPAVALAAVIGGFWPGLLSAVVGAALASYFFWAPYQTFVFELRYQTVLSNTVFLIDALFVCTAIEAMHRFYRRFADAEHDLQLAASVFHNSADGIMVTDDRGTILTVNPAFTEITGYTADEAIGCKPSLLRSDHQGPDFYRAMWDTLAREGCWQGELWNRRKSGEAYSEWLTINRVTDSAGVAVRYVGVFHDITELRQKDERIRHLAFHDALTNLPNRALIQDRLEHALQRARREQTRLAVTFIDLDRFKAVNDSLGHAMGDVLLQEVAGRIGKRLRSMDTLARLGGDEFVLLMEDLHGTEDCASLAQAIIAEISRPVDLHGHTVQIGASLGMAFYPEDGGDTEELMKRADVAMYAAKAAGRNTYRFFQQQMLDLASRRLALEMDLRLAVANADFELHYQPKVDLATGQTRAVEALVRWRHANRGLVPPGEFIPLAEDSELILALGDWVLNEACRQAALWQANGCLLKIAVNVAARQLEQGGLAERIVELTRQHGIPASALEVEVTESMVMTRPEQAASLLARLREIGVSVAIDDFGTGYSSLAYLRRLPIDVLKIDRSFVMHADCNDEDAQIVKTIVALGQSLKLLVVAEGIENEGQAALLRSMGCDRGQGFHFSRPLPAARFEAWLAGQADGSSR